jgi:phage tail sheath protein FI
MIAYAEQRRAFAILDLPPDVNLAAEAEAWLTANEQLRRANAAAYFPRILIADVEREVHVRSFPNSGAVAGVYARTDQQRGVWKAPAGLDAELNGAVGLECILTAGQQDEINVLGLNALRSFHAHSNVVWGSRTLAGADTLASEWKYVPVRRTALFIEESLYRGLQWAALEPNAEPLWARVRLSAGSFMHDLFRQGAFQGSTARECYAVKCDAQTTNQADIDAGLMNLHVGFAPLKPAEFLWLRIQVRASS